MLNVRNRKGFTLIEVIVVAGIIAILAGILVPMIFNQIDEAKIAKAKGEVKAIQTAIMMFKKDNGCFPNRTIGTDSLSNTIEVLFSEGTPIANLATTTNWNGPSGQLLDHLRANNNAYPAATWKGPYLADAPTDPWGNSYMVGAKNFDEVVAGSPPLAPKSVWVISAGPDGILQTGINDRELAGDDIGIRIK